MEYIAKLETDDGAVLVSFPDCPGCQTEGADMADARVQAQEALAGWLETHLQEGLLPPRPAFRGKGMAVGVPAALGLKLELRWARADAGLTQSELAKRLGVTQQMIAKLENPDYEPSLSKAELVARALGLTLSTSLVERDFSQRKSKRRPYSAVPSRLPVGAEGRGAFGPRARPNERTISPKLAEVVGTRPVTRAQVIKKLWEYFEKNRLNDGQTINLDAKLKAVYGNKKAIKVTEVDKALAHLKR